MKAISIKEPWASMILQGLKTIETRTWKTNYRGPIVICASKKPASPMSGKAICTANLYDCRPMTFEDQHEAKCEIYPKAYSWCLKNIEPLTPFEIKGKLGLFNVELALVAFHRGLYVAGIRS